MVSVLSDNYSYMVHGHCEEFQLDNFFDYKISLYKVLRIFHLLESKTPCTALYSPSDLLYYYRTHLRGLSFTEKHVMQLQEIHQYFYVTLVKL